MVRRVWQVRLVPSIVAALGVACTDSGGPDGIVLGTVSAGGYHTCGLADEGAARRG